MFMNFKLQYDMFDKYQKLNIKDRVVNKSISSFKKIPKHLNKSTFSHIAPPHCPIISGSWHFQHPSHNVLPRLLAKCFGVSMLLLPTWQKKRGRCSFNGIWSLAKAAILNMVLLWNGVKHVFGHKGVGQATWPPNPGCFMTDLFVIPTQFLERTINHSENNKS